jgi:hypothetical protein
MSNSEIKKESETAPAATTSAFFRLYEPPSILKTPIATMAPVQKTVLKNEPGEQAIRIPKWRQNFSASERLKQVVTKEKAAAAARQCLTHMKSILERQQATYLSRTSQLWIERIGTDPPSGTIFNLLLLFLLSYITLLTQGTEAIFTQLKEDRILVGVRGSTGSGKSTLISAILRMNNLLPTESYKACTATPVEIAYNYSDDENELFRAEVEFATGEEWKNELEVLFQDVRAHFRETDEDSTFEDQDRKERIMDGLAKIKSVYLHLCSIENLRDISVAELMDNEEVQDVLSSTAFIRSGRQNQFSHSIRKFISTGEVDRKNFAHWPLVKRVKVFVKSQILESGIVLCDLPGSMDSNSARGSIGGDYQKHLAVTIMVVDARRGIDDQNVSIVSSSR